MGIVAPADKHIEAITTENAATPAQIDASGVLDAATDILDAIADRAIPVAELHGGDGDEEQASDYWDASSMAPLNAVSAVSISPRAA